MAKKIKKMSIEEINAELKKTYNLSVIEIEGFLDELAKKTKKSKNLLKKQRTDLLKREKTEEEPKKQEETPDYNGFENFIIDYVDSKETKKLQAIDEGCKTFNIGKTQANKILKNLIQEKKEADEKEKREELEVEREEKMLGQKQPTAKDLLLEAKMEEEIENLKEGEINWIEDPYWIKAGWDGLKGKMKKIWGHKREYTEEKPKWFFLAHDGDTIKGKPQLIFSTLQKFPLFRQAVLKHEVKDEDGKKTGEEKEIQSFYAFDESFDKRYDGFQKDAFSMDFWVYRVISQQDKEIMLWSKEKFPNCNCTIKGMNIEVDDMAEMSRSLKIKKISNIFLVKEFEPDVKLLTKDQIVKWTKERNITEEEWFIYLAKHPNGNYNFFPQETEYRKSALVLGGKFDGYPNHCVDVGPAGTGKTMGIIETLAYKFSETPSICEAAASRLKGLEPSYKEKPMDIGFLAKAERVGFIDELLKLVENESQKSHNPLNNQLGNLNMFMEHKIRSLVSGIDSGVSVQATAKFWAVANPMSNKSNIYSHVGIIDPTFMSRNLWFVQDDDEQAFILRDGVFRVPRTLTQEHTDKILKEKKEENTQTEEKKNNIVIENRKKYILLKKCSGDSIEIMNREEFLTLFDTCYAFACEIDEGKVENLVNITTMLAREPMKTSVWKPRAFHHVYLLLDGLVKHRCLFKDYDPTFTPKQEDYDLAERILVRMVKSWDTDLSPKKEIWN